MIFQRKFQRGMELLRKKNGNDPEQADPEQREIETKKRVPQEELKLERHDRLAMVLSAFMVFLPVALIVLLAMCLPLLLVALMH